MNAQKKKRHWKIFLEFILWSYKKSDSLVFFSIEGSRVYCIRMLCYLCRFALSYNTVSIVYYSLLSQVLRQISTYIYVIEKKSNKIISFSLFHFFGSFGSWYYFILFSTLFSRCLFIISFWHFVVKLNSSLDCRKDLKHYNTLFLFLKENQNSKNHFNLLNISF